MPPLALPAAQIAAIKSSNKSIYAQQSHRRQLARNTARKKANLAVIGARSQASQQTINARAAGAAGVIAARQQARSQNISAARSADQQDRVVGAITSTATPSSDSGLIMTVIFMMAGLIVVYTLVTNPGPTTGWLGTLGNSLHALSSNKPLFTTTAK